MPSYRYEAAKANGQVERGLVDADTPRSARQLLRGRGLLPLSINPVGRASNKVEWFRRSLRLSDTDLGWITRQLAGLLAAGLSLEAALGAIIDQLESHPAAAVLAAVRSDIRAGHRLSDAMSAHPRAFPPVYLALTEAGETSGELAAVMDRLASYVESRSQLRNKVVTAFIYPAVVLFVAMAIVTFLLIYVVPQVVGAFSQTQQVLPLLTRMLLALSEFAQQWGGLLVLVLVLLYAGWRGLLRTPAVRLRWHGRVLSMPFVGRFVKEVNTARYAATLAILAGSGVPLVTALPAAARTLSNRRLQQAANEAARRVREGSTLAAALQSHRVFPPLLIHLIDSGERTGRLPEMLERGAQSLAQDVERRAVTMTALLEPLLTLVMGLVVLVIVLAIMMPIIEMNQMIQ
ncbi:MAG TPA: type II secretion system protein GspF [Pusillimonas sp.]|jgi:general secretion pathway protein F|nr:type II secretion system protein GspF [Pusillimonas sp.]MBC42169.1 type II secretion system protein GspF [Pusillimonas sp.]HBT32696.1 type II secretion system protein GspF [Pusillimonas sp.]|tara:strand:+ start:43122 stop:44333 length:1212 start_codon:yes stop_codon:yes gene_type:complete